MKKRMTAVEREVLYDRIVEAIKAGKSITQIHGELHTQPFTIYRACASRGVVVPTQYSLAEQKRWAIADAMRNGMGVHEAVMKFKTSQKTVHRSLDEAGLPRPASERAPWGSRRAFRLLRLIRNDPKRTLADLANELQCSGQRIRELIDLAVEEGLVENDKVTDS